MKSGKQKSTINAQEMFANIENPQMQRSTFDRSSGLKTTLDAGKLYPVFYDQALPGDTFNLKATMFGRLATPIKPIMDNIKFDLHFFSVPYRLVWDNWQKFMGEQVDPGDSIDYLIPTTKAPAGTGHAELSIGDYFGLPTKIAELEHDVLPLRAYNLIYNEWYRDQNLNDSVTVNRGDGPDDIADYAILDRNKRKDYFTSALPFAQKGDAVSLPLGTRANVQHDSPDNQNLHVFSSVNDEWRRVAANLTNITAASTADADTTDKQLYIDLTQATASTINEIRLAFQQQRFLERDARGGTRYVELIKSHFGVTSPDYRLQRPEYLGGGSVDVNIMPVAKTAEEGTDPQGNLSGVGTFSVNNNGFTKSFTEHEMIIGIVSVRADITYQQGLNRMWSRETRFDFYWPTFAHLGEQSVLNKEIYAQNDANDDLTFGYQERYAEYRYKPSQITGLYRSNASASLDVWHLAQDFSSLPALNAGFIKEDPPIDRVIAVPSEPQFLLDALFDLKCVRPMPTYSTPGLIDHF
jgi:hypothetical protein